MCSELHISIILDLMFSEKPNPTCTTRKNEAGAWQDIDMYDKIDDDKEWERRRKVCRQVKKVLTPSSTLFNLPAVNVVICNVSQLIICNLRTIFIDMNVCRKPVR